MTMRRERAFQQQSHSLEIPFNRPSIVGREEAYMAEALSRGHISGDGEFTRRCQELLVRELGVGAALLTTSCTHALEMAAILLEISPGDEVLVPDFTFVSTANAFVLRGARPVFVDIRPDTLNLDESLLEGLITPRTRAICPVHYAGIGCDMEAIGRIAGAHGLAIIEDNAHGLFARRSGRFLGTYGQLAALSFHETKNFYCGEGGALLVNDPALVERAEIVREKGTDRKRYFRGEVDKYTWVDVGSSYVISDLLAAFLLGQLEERKKVLSLRRAIFERYLSGLETWAASHGVTLPRVPSDCQSSYHMFYLVLPNAAARTRLIEALRARGILAVFHYLPLHRSRMGRRFAVPGSHFPVTDAVSERLVRLPFYNTLTEPEQRTVIETILSTAL
jgi:dTDP-4-amino-4,6-dideoxygalactose transaminase